MSSSVHINKKKKDILQLGKGSTQAIDDAKLTAVAWYSINFSISQINFCLSLHYKGSNGLSFFNATKIDQFKAKGSEIKNIVCV